MVVIDYPDSESRRFFMVDGTLLGPFDSKGIPKSIQVPLEVNSERFEPKKRIYGENEIVHSSFHGRVIYYPILADCIPQPTAVYPRALRLPYGTSGYTVYAQYGFGCPYQGALVRSHADPQPSMQTVEYDPVSNTWTVLRTILVGERSYCYEYRYNITGWVNPNRVRVLRQYRYSLISVIAPYHYRSDATYGGIRKAHGLVGSSWTKYNNWTGAFDVYTTNPSSVRYVEDLRQDLGVLADNLMRADFPLEEVAYGELAARAADKRRRIDVNLYELIRDLSDVKSLIPSLSNLKSLKERAGNFLYVKYGVMPTISDLRKIFSAFKARVPYLDRFGNSVFTAAHISSMDEQQCSFTLEQHVKVPVANEDSEFLRLIEALDEVGLSLTLENIWDLVKYSFVIDWFVDVGGFLQRIDQRQRITRYNIPYVTVSRKQTVQGEVPFALGLSFFGPIEWRYYHRWVDSHCPLPPLTLSTTPTVSDHWLEAGALIIQRAL